MKTKSFMDGLVKRITDKNLSANSSSLERDSGLLSLEKMSSEARMLTVRVLVNFQDGKTGMGTGFCLKNNLILTCAHVITGPPRGLLNSLKKTGSNGTDQEKINSHLANFKPALEVEDSDGKRHSVDLIEINSNFDFAILKSKEKIGPHVEISHIHPQLGTEVFFCGFPTAPHIIPLEWPFAVNAGFISSKLKTTVADLGAREYLQINAINLEGNSGGPLLSRINGKLIGMINGNMTRGNDSLLGMMLKPDGTPVVQQNGVPVLGPSPLRIPLGIAYATSINQILENSLELREYIH